MKGQLATFMTDLAVLLHIIALAGGCTTRLPGFEVAAL
jgi:hypothetical protein